MTGLESRCQKPKGSQREVFENRPLPPPLTVRKQTGGQA